MTFTYTDPSTYPRDEFRLMVGDTDSADPVFTDAEVTYFLSKNSNVAACAAIGCRAAAAKYARQVNYSLGELSEQLKQKAENFTALAKELESQIGRYSFSSTTPSVGTVQDSGTQPHDYDVSGEKAAEWSLNPEDLPDEVRGVDT